MDHKNFSEVPLFCMRRTEGKKGAWPIPIPITDITSFVIYAFFIMLNVYCLASKLGDAGGASAPSLFCPPWGFLLLITTFFGVKSPSCTSTIYLTLVLMSISVGLPIWHSVSADTDNRYR